MSVLQLRAALAWHDTAPTRAIWQEGWRRLLLTSGIEVGFGETPMDACWAVLVAPKNYIGIIGL